jgi:REP element-mobilizing transposase RayT
VTFRLGDSLPQAKINQWREEVAIWREENPEPWNPEQHDHYHRRFTYRLEEWLDSGHGECLLRDPKHREALSEILMKFQDDRVIHHAWVIMPNHVHLLFTPKVPLRDLIKAWKGTSARRIGRGSIWQSNYRDTLIRDPKHFVNAARYIRRNPKGLAQNSYTLWEGERVRAIP